MSRSTTCFLLAHSHSHTYQRHRRIGTTTLSFRERRISPTFQGQTLTIHVGQCQLAVIGVATAFPFVIQRPPFLSSTLRCLSRDSKSGLNLVPPLLPNTPFPLPRIGMMISKTRPTPPLATPLHDPITSPPSFQVYPNRKTGMTTSMVISLCHRKNTNTKHGIRPTKRMPQTLSTKRRTRPSPPVLVRLPSLSRPPLPKCRHSHFYPYLWERPSLVLLPHLFFRFPPDATLQHIPLLPISPCVAAALLPLLCYPQAHLRKEPADDYEKSPALLTIMSLSSLTDNRIPLPCPHPLTPPLRTRKSSIFLLPKPLTRPELLFCHVSGLSPDGAFVRDGRVLPVTLLRAQKTVGMPHPVPPLPRQRLHLGLQVGFFGRRTRLIRPQVPH